jgi:hypothetical protein
MGIEVEVEWGEYDLPPKKLTWLKFHHLRAQPITEIN